jgi:hypothetical protein
MGKRWVFSLLTMTIMLGLIGLLTFTGESVHRIAEPRRPLTEAARPPVEPETGPVLHGSGLMLTY